MKRIKFLFTLAAILLAGVVSAQNITVKGTVADRETGEPIPFASIQVKGTTAGVAADVDGRFTIDVASNATLIFSFIGYKTIEVPVSGRSTIHVDLEVDTETLEEVVFVAFGTVAKKTSRDRQWLLRVKNLKAVLLPTWLTHWKV